MSNAKIVSYDLCQPGRDYSKLITRIQQYRNCKLTESCWLISSTLSCEQLRNDFLRLIDANDRIYVAALTGEAAWHNMLSSNETIKSILNNI